MRVLTACGTPYEIGHAIGLKHPHDGSPTLPAVEDNYAVTVMSYTFVGRAPATPMTYDLLALHYLYGRRASHALVPRGHRRSSGCSRTRTSAASLRPRRCIRYSLSVGCNAGGWSASASSRISSAPLQQQMGSGQ